MAGASAFPFEVAMGFAFVHLRLSPDDFWSMSPREFSACLLAARGDAGLVTPPDRSLLDALMARFPDHTTAMTP